MASSISACGRLGWTSSLLRAGWRSITLEGEKASRHERKNMAEDEWERLNSYSALLGERSVRWVFYGENSDFAVGTTSGSLSEEVGESVDSEPASLSSSHAWRYTYQVSIINDLDKIEVKIGDEDQALLLLSSSPSSYKSFREAIIYGGKSIIKVNEVKEHLLNKNRIDTQLTG